MYTLYLDESGDWGYPNYDANYPILCLCGCIIDDDYYQGKVVPTVRQIKRREFRKDVVLHRYKIQHRTGDFAVLRTREKLDAFVTEFSSYVSSQELTFLLSAIDKADYRRTYGTKRVDPYLPMDIYSIVLTFTLERFVLFLGELKSRGQVVAESRGTTEDQAVQYWYSLILRNGTQFIQGWQFRQVLPTAVVFRRKQENIVGLQLADWVARPMARIVQYPDGSQDTYGEWALYRRKIWVGQTAPARGQVGFKVFPKNLGRRLLNMPLKSAKDSD